jgi:hypothetical protein
MILMSPVAILASFVIAANPWLLGPLALLAALS